LGKQAALGNHNIEISASLCVNGATTFAQASLSQAPYKTVHVIIILVVMLPFLSKRLLVSG
jgi:hypothetical protein